MSMHHTRPGVWFSCFFSKRTYHVTSWNSIQHWWSWACLLWSGVNLAGILGDRCGSRRLDWVWGGCTPSSQKRIFHLKWRILVHSERHFCPCSRQKNVEFPPEVVICNSAHSKFWGLVPRVSPWFTPPSWSYGYANVISRSAFELRIWNKFCATSLHS